VADGSAIAHVNEGNGDEISHRSANYAS
jgi:hypothetical protein